MSEYLSTWGRNRLAIGICGRCSLKFALDDLEPDINYPGLLVCAADSDLYDPYRLPPRETEDITLDMPRPDTALVLTLQQSGADDFENQNFWSAGALNVFAGSLFFTAGAPAGPAPILP